MVIPEVAYSLSLTFQDVDRMHELPPADYLSNKSLQGVQRDLAVEGMPHGFPDYLLGIEQAYIEQGR